MLKITLSGKKGVDYNAYVDDYFSDFTMDGFPIFLGGDGQYDGKQIVLLDEIEAKPKNTEGAGPRLPEQAGSAREFASGLTDDPMSCSWAETSRPLTRSPTRSERPSALRARRSPATTAAAAVAPFSWTASRSSRA